MMMIPSKRNFDIFDSIWNDPFFEGGKRKHQEIMKTDVKEKDGNYVLEIDVPGYNKEDIQIELENGYLTVTAKANTKIDEEKDGYVYRERFIGECSRSYYAGENIKEEDIKASFKNGTLELTFPKEGTKQIENKKIIQID